MTPLSLSPLPSVRPDERSDALQIERDGFVDEAVVMEMVNAPLRIRMASAPPDPSLPMDELDFAGWQPVARHFQPVPAPAVEPEPTTTSVPQVHPARPPSETIARRAAPPSIDDSPAIEETPQEFKIPWLACLAGIILGAAIWLALFFLLNRPTGTQPRDSRIERPPAPMAEEPAEAKPPLTPLR